ncbi:MAG: PTS fructose transporter subunit IIA, partial [Alphaproteobacteria bacterium]|nr:PTS fructose transporter subunit IIA [Alphaproteobacteria bacterium]
NLPMLVKLAGVRAQKTLTESVHDAQESGKKYISVASALLKGEVA